MPLHPMVWLLLSGVAIVGALALVDAWRYRRRLRRWRPDPPLTTSTHPSRVWEVQADEGRRRR